MPGPIHNRPSLQSYLRANEGKTVEVVNVSANPEAVTARTDGTAVQANWQQFTGSMPDVQEGDVLRVRTRGSNGNVSNWITLQSQGLQEKDTRNAQIYSDAIGMELNKEGTIDLIYLGDGMVSEPGAKVRLKNEISGEVFDYTVDENGQLPADLQLRGEQGDIFSVAVSDGVNNVDFSEQVGLVEVEGAPRINLPDPAVWAKKHLNAEGKPKVKTVEFSGPLFINEPSIEDVKQGSLANCYFASAVASIAHSDPEALKDMIQKNDDGTYTVTFKKRNAYGQVRDQKVRVDGDLYVSYGEKPLYGSSNGPERGAENIEMWFPILEKAYAALHENSYDEIGNGGSPSKVFSSILGRNTSYRRLKESNSQYIFEDIQRSLAKGRPVTATTYGKDSAEADRYPGTRLYPWHTYSVMGVEEKNGKQFVQLRNPWGSTEPGYDGKDDGIFLLELDKFTHFFKGVDLSR